MDPICEHFEKKLSLTFGLAFAAGVLNKATTWMGSGTLAWATVVLMGGFASNLSIADFVDITFLVLFIVLLLGLSLLTCKLVTEKSLSTGSYRPLRLRYRDKRHFVVNVIKFISFLLQCSLLAYSFHISASKLQRPDFNFLYSYVFSKPHVDALASAQACLESCSIRHRFTDVSALETCAQFCFPAQNSTNTTTTNLQVCLFTFHCLVTTTCILGLLCNLYIFFRVAEFCWLTYSGGSKTLSLTRYHDEVLSRALNIGLVDAYDFDAREFMLNCVAEDLVVRNIAPLEVKSQNEDFIKYLLYYPKGVEMVMGKLASENTMQQQMAANMPGFWSSESKHMKNFGMALLSRLGEKLGMPGKVAEGAANSFKSLAIAWKDEDPSPLLKVSVSRSGAGGSTNAVSRSERGGGGGHNSVSGGPGAGAPAGETSGGGEGRGDSSGGVPNTCVGQGGGGGGGSSGVPGGGGGRGGNELKWNVVQKVVHLVANTRLPTVLVYVRALDSFFLSNSVTDWLAKEERELYFSIKRELKNIIQGDKNKPRTKLLAFSAWERLESHTELAGNLLRELGPCLNPPLPQPRHADENKFLIWIDEVDRYKELCTKYSYLDHVNDWPSPEMWEIRGPLCNK